MTDENESYADWTVEELREEASAREIEGRSGMNKDELVDALELYDQGEEAGTSPKDRPSAAEVLADARGQVEEALGAVNADLEADDHTDPERFQGLKDERALLLDALNHHLTLEPVEEPVEEVA